MVLKANWTFRKWDVKRIWRLVQNYFQISLPLNEIIEKIQAWLFQKQVCFVMKNFDWFEVSENHNVIPNVVREHFATLLTWQTSPTTFNANFIALGDWTATPSLSDEQLENETIRGEFTNRYTIDNVAYFDKFFASGEVNWMFFGEAWIFCDWTSSPDSWFLLSRVNVEETIWPNQVLTINCSIAITSST